MTPRPNAFGAALLSLLIPPGLVLAESVALESPVDDPPDPLLEAAVDPSTELFLARVEPLVIRVGIDTLRIEIGVWDPEVRRVTLFTDEFTKDGVALESIVLNDSGLDGDQVPANRVFTAGDLELASTPVTLAAKLLVETEMEFLLANGQRRRIVENLGLPVLYIQPSVPIPDVETLDFDVRATDRVMSVAVAPGGSFPAHRADDAALIQRYYEFFPDDRDFLLLDHPYPALGYGDIAAEWHTVRNDVLGIGDFAPFRDILFDDTAFYGSDSVLQGYANLLYATSAWYSVVNHEVLHRWAAHIGLDLESRINPGHWHNAMLRPSSGFGTFVSAIEEQPDGTYRVLRKIWEASPQGELLAPNDFYNDLELYFAGLIDFSQVESPIQILWDGVVLEDCGLVDLSRCWIMTGDLRSTPTSVILDTWGPRIPDSSTSRKHFRSGLIVDHYRPLTDVEMAYYEYAMQNWERDQRGPADLLHRGPAFREATSGLATVSTTLLCSDPDGDEVCDPVDVCPTIPNPDQDPEICDQRIVDVTVSPVVSPEAGGRMVTWRTTHEVNLEGFDVVILGPNDSRRLAAESRVPCTFCSTGDGSEYSLMIEPNLGVVNLFIEPICSEDCGGPVGPAALEAPPS